MIEKKTATMNTTPKTEKKPVPTGQEPPVTDAQRGGGTIGQGDPNGTKG